MKRLFFIRKPNGKMYNPDSQFIDFYHDGSMSVEGYFHNKMDAKIVRNALGGVEAGYHVSRGPDHIGPHGEQPYPKMRRQSRILGMIK